ncbi:hypothetical protein AB0D59_06360 [Streptomyces sp. NPDC048417]|uniref:hypothetical protein n=1 Tax=Streptomyces sp. NPDC048417 TaxID=3155387 RepID=UPI003413F323
MDNALTQSFCACLHVELLNRRHAGIEPDSPDARPFVDGLVRAYTEFANREDDP